jgi:hypothetical protein
LCHSFEILSVTRLCCQESVRDAMREMPKLSLDQRKYSKSVSTFILRWIMRM